MKKLLVLLALAITFLASAQAPQGFNYQATVRNPAGVLITNQNVSFKFNVLLNSQTSSPVFSETHIALTDALGQVNLVIGFGTPTVGTFSSINWGSGNFYLGIEMNAGLGFVQMGTMQLLSVPYALYANSSGTVQTIPNLANVLGVNNSANNTKIVNLQNPTDAQDAVTKGYADAVMAQLQTQIVSLQSQINALQNLNENPIPSTPLPNVQIGGQIWQNSNLDVSTYRDGTPIPEVTDPSQWANLTTGAWCYQVNTTNTDGIYGKLYNWYAVVGIHNAASLSNPSLRKKLAPQGWHIPSDPEWIILTNYLGGENAAGGKMKTTGFSQWTSPNTGATNESGFNGLPGGYRNAGAQFSGIGNLGYWWSSTESDTNIAFHRGLFYFGSGASRIPSNKTFGFSVRCLKD